MDFGRQLWAAYLEKHMPATERPAMDTLRGAELAKRLWALSAALKPYAAAIEHVPFDPTFDQEVDEALIEIAIAGDFAALDTISLGAWRVLACRWGWAIAAVMIEESAGAGISVPVPARASPYQRILLATLAVLGGPARDVPPVWCERTAPEELDRLLMRGPAWPH